MNAPIDRLILPFQRFLRAEASGGLLLMGAAAAALVWANSPLAESYAKTWGTTLTIGFGEGALTKPVLLWINDALMAVFFLLVGLEIKREILVGELKSPRKALLPIIAAIGGMAGPAIIYAASNWGTPEVRGWGVPMATDIAFALGVCALLGKRVPLALKVFLTAVAIIDDLGAVAVIAIFYTESIKTEALIAAGVISAALVVVNRLGVRNLLVYVLLGAVLWFAVLKSGIHATIAGVLLAAAIPSSVRISRDGLTGVMRSSLNRLESSSEDSSKSQVDQTVIHDLEMACERAQSPLLRLEHALLPWVAFVIMPIFALANAGVDLRGYALGDIVNPITLGIACGLFFGNQIGIVGMTWLAVRSGLGALPSGVTWRQIHGASLLAGIGFTMSLFIAALAFSEPENHNLAKLGILLGSFVSGVLGFALLAMSSPAKQPEQTA